MNGKKVGKQVLLIKTGGTIKKITPLYEDFENWFALYMDIHDFMQVDVFRGQTLPKPGSVAGVVVTGSAAMVSERADWSETAADWLAVAVGQGVPVLGVCYGHQLLAHALGGRVGPNPLGRQIGTVQVQLTRDGQDDRLLGHLPAAFAAQSSHLESVLEIPRGTVRLARSPRDYNFALRFAENAWGVQFHPEFSAPVMREYIHCRSEALHQEGLQPAQLLQQVTDTPQARSVLPGFKALLGL
ncbi:MAG: glutamine amidotransferase [Xanthomonadales bacterium]|nr:glutamine amidotransferase [Xanthomonadales bacterium]